MGDRRWRVLAGAALVAVAVVVLGRALTSGPSGPAFEDDFAEGALDRTRWATCYHWRADACTNEWNAELQAYRRDNVSVRAGTVRLEARRERVRGHLFDGSAREFEYSSGMLSTHGRHVFTYGYVEVRARVPAGRGLWPALWLYPAAERWPPEIDILEVVGHEPQVAHFAVHSASGEEPQRFRYRGPDLSAGWHVFALDWRPDVIRFLVDGVERARTTRAIPHEPMFFIANLSVGGRWPGPPDGHTRFPAAFELDHVRIWDHGDGLPEGRFKAVDE